ncbi:uncharacterized protein LOC134271737 [Saccostrea cucullata]|uniref:uncharacterized protein LOC134271737 n=1 Tax=Saccostrea cuccullata TaxID=36930 RepID=UPI002ED13AE9
MASGFAQHYVECTTCDSNAEYHCNTCQFDLCQACKETHQRKKKTENHEVVLYKEREEKVQERCCTHSDKIYDACCKECEIPVCIKCIMESHSCHAIVEIEVMFNEKLEMFTKQIQELKEKIIPQCEDIQKNISQKMENCRKSLSQIRSDLLATAQSIKDLVDLILKEKTENLSKIEDSLMKELQSHEKEMKTYTDDLNSIIEDVEVLRRTGKKAEFIIKHKEKLLIHHLESLGDMFYTPTPSFTSCSVSKEQIEKLFGDVVEKPKIPLPGTSDLHRLVEKARFFPPYFEIAMTFEEIGHIDVSGVNKIHHIVFQDENTFWVNDGSECLRQTDMQGQILHTIKTASNGDGIHTFTEHGILYIAPNKRDIHLSGREGKVRDLITINDWDLKSVYKSRLNGDIFVGMRKESTDARVTRYNENGEILQHIQYTKQHIGSNPNPHFITENRNGDVIVTSNGNKKVVVVMDRSGRYRFSYTGNPGNSIANPWGVVTDILKNILICDSDNKRIQIINEDGMFLAYINVPNAYGFLSAVDVDDMHYVWVGFSSSGTIRKFRYLQE